MTTPSTDVVPTSEAWAHHGGVGEITRDGTRHGHLGSELALFYRLRSFQQLVAGPRALFYTVFGYTLAAHGDVSLRVVNLVLIVLLFMCFGAYDNYVDWRLMGERNGTSIVMAWWHLPRVAGLLLVFAPWGLIIPLLGWARNHGMSYASEVLFWLMSGLGMAYITPGVRLKDRPLSFFIAPLWACLLFAQAVILERGSAWNLTMSLLSGVAFALQCQAELLHRIDDGLQMVQAESAQRVQRLHRWLQRLPVLTCGAALASVVVQPLLLNTVCWSVVRFWAIRRFPINGVPAIRRQWWHPVWSLYEFAIYAGLGTAHLFG